MTSEEQFRRELHHGVAGVLRPFRDGGITPELVSEIRAAVLLHLEKYPQAHASYRVECGPGTEPKTLVVTVMEMQPRLLCQFTVPGDKETP